MPSLYLTDAAQSLRVQDARFIICEQADDHAPRKILAELEPHRVEMVGLIGGAHATRDALDLCLTEGITVAWFWRNGRFRGRILPELPRSADLRLRQYARSVQVDDALTLGREFILSKLCNARSALLALQSNHPGLEACSHALAHIAERSAQIPTLRQPAELLGAEGSAARAYFSALAHGFRSEITFSGRSQRPPMDAANAALSFAYTLLSNLISGRLEARGLDPALGFLHEPRSGRASLALDLLEEFRVPFVDRFVMRSCNLRQLLPEHFEPPTPEEGVRMTKAGLGQFFTLWERHLAQPLRTEDNSELLPMEIVHRQIERLVADLRGGESYRGFRLP